MENVSILMYLKSKRMQRRKPNLPTRNRRWQEKEVSLRSIDPSRWDQNKQRGTETLRGNHQIKQNACVGRKQHLLQNRSWLMDTLK
jgi:hypothetical protein